MDVCYYKDKEEKVSIKELNKKKEKFNKNIP